jgi:ribose transport system substrate-binding protein
MKKIMALILVIVMSFTLFSCSNGETPDSSAANDSAETSTEPQEKVESGDSGGSEDKKITVAYSIPEMFSTFWAACVHGFEEQAKEFGWEAVILDPQGDIELQISQLQNQITMETDALCVSPIEKDAVGTALTEFTKQGVPVFCIDRRAEGEVISTLETDNVEAGRAMAKQIIEDYGEEIKVLIIRGNLSDAPTIDRHAGAMEVFNQYEGVEVVGDPSAGAYTDEAAMATTKNYLESNPDLDVIFLCTDAHASGCVAALHEAGYTGVRGEENHIGVYSVDGEGKVLDMIREGIMDGVYSQYPIQFGRDVVKAMKAYFDGEKIEEKVYYGGDVVTTDNIDSFGEGKLWGDIIR